MNAHLPQSYEAMVELEEIAAVPHHIITPRHAKPMIGVYQDTLVGSFRLTQPGIEFTRREFMNLMMWNKRFDGTMPIARGTKERGDRWTGQQVLGALMPPVNIEMGNKSYDSEKENSSSDNYVKIVEGDIQQGVVDGDIYMKPSKGIIHVAYNDCGSKDTVGLLDALQNTVENFLVLNGFSVGISDLIADEETKMAIDAKIQEKKKQVEQVILQVHMDLFDNNTGKTNQQEFEDQIFGILNQATSDAGATGQQSLSLENRLLAMVRSGSKGEPLNVAQMMACLGQTAIEGKRVPYGFTDRTLPHYKKYDDSSEARGFIESSFIRGLTPQQFFFHAMSGREGLIDTAVKSVTADTEIIMIENGTTKWTKIGPWIDAHLSDARAAEVEHYEEANMELLNLTNEVYIPTTDMDGKMSWGKMTAITRHDPGDVLYKITTKGGKDVIVTAGKSLLIWDDHLQRLKEVYTKDVNVGDCVPVTMNFPSAPMTVTHMNMSEFFPKTEYVHGTDFHIAKDTMAMAQGDKFHIPRGWWEKSNGTTFTLPYPSKARFQRVLSGRSKVEHIQPGSIYAYHAERTDVQIPERFELNEENGIFIGLFLADGNADIPSGYVQITKNDESVRTFVKNWFTKMGMKFKESSRDMTLPTVNDTVSNGTSTEVRGFSRLVAQFLTAFVGHGSEHKHVPDIAFTAPLEFVKGLLNGYISGDGYVSKNSIEITSVSHRMLDGIAMLCSRLGVFAYQSKMNTCTNNIGTKHILPTYRLHIRSLWANHLKNVCSLIHTEKQEKLMEITTSASHVHYEHHNDIVLDTIIAITEVSTELYPKMYDVTVPSTLNFAIANGINCRDTADTGYIQRQLIKSMEDLTVQHDGTVRDANNNIVQYHYGEDGINPTKIETQSLPIGKLSQEEIRIQFGMVDVDWSNVFKDGAVRENDEELIAEYIQELIFDQRMMVEGVFQKKTLDSGSVFAPVNLARWVLNIKTRFALLPAVRKEDEDLPKTDLTPAMVLNGIKKIIGRTHGYHKIWCALLRFHLAPHKLIVKERFTKDAFEMLMEIIVATHMKSWVQPGEQVGIVAAQSIGEPATQMSSVKDSLIVLQSDNGLKYYGTIGEICDSILEENKEKLIHHGVNSVILPLEENYYIVGVSEDEKTSWKRISEISRHPANGGLVEVMTRTGRKTTATLTHSFLKRSPTGIVPVLGSELKVGMRIPIAKVVPEVPQPIMSMTKGNTTFMMNKEFGWVCGMYVADGFFSGNIIGISKVNPMVEVKLRAFAEQYDMRFNAVHRQCEYGPSKNNNLYSKDLKDFLMETFNTGSYEKQIGATVFHANKEFIAGVIGGFFDGDGNVSVERQLIRASSRSETLIQQFTALLGYVGMFGVMSQEKSVRIKDKIQHTLVIPRKFAKTYKEQVGFQLPEKAEALDKIIEYNERQDVHSEQEMIDKIPELGPTIAETGKLLKMPGQSRTYGRWAKKESIGRQTLTKYVEEFEAKCKELDENVEKYDRVKVQTNMSLLTSALAADVLWDEITELIYHEDPKEYVYDFTVPGNDSFMVDCNVLVHNTLNTFHQAGVASKSAVTRGVPRLRELLKVTQNPKASSLTIYLKPEYRNNKDKAREVVQELELTVLRNITNKVAIYWDEKDESTVVEEDKELMRFYALFEEEFMAQEKQEEIFSKWMLRMELNREEMFNRNISMQEVVTVIKNQFNGEINVVYSDYNSDKLVMRIRLPDAQKRDKDTASQLDDFTNLKKFQNKLLNSIVIRGVPGIKAVTFRNDKQYVEDVGGRYETFEQYVLDTDGSNFIKVMNHPVVDGTKLYSTNVWDVYEVLGIEATRAVLFNEISGLFESVGVNYRHLCLLCDVMTRCGKLMSIDRYGINKNDIGTLAKASFEETEKILLKAALFGEVDPVTGVSANIMMGQPIRGGTAFSQILLDDMMLPELLKSIDIEKRLEREEEGDLSRMEESDGQMDPCSSTQFKMNMVMPSIMSVMEEEDIELVIA
jgi:DNA-directed RNA polymerase beta' subunit